MKKVVAFLISLTILGFTLCLFASCIATGGKIPNVVDNADLLTNSQKQALTEKIDALREKYDFDIALHTTNSIGNKTITAYADDYYDYNGYGVGEKHDGLLFMLNMGGGVGNRDYYTSTTGFGLIAFSDYAIADYNSYISKEVVTYLSRGEYYEAFDKYLDLADAFLKAAKAGRPYSYEHRYVSLEENIGYEIVIIAVALIIAFIIVLGMKRKMNNAVRSVSASGYIKEGSMNLIDKKDVLVNVRTSKTPKSPPPSAGGGGRGGNGGSFGGVHVGSSGTSHGGGGGKF